MYAIPPSIVVCDDECIGALVVVEVLFIADSCGGGGGCDSVEAVQPMDVIMWECRLLYY